MADRPSRRPPVEDFDYSASKKLSPSDALEGFGLNKDKALCKKISNKLELLLEELRPDWRRNRMSDKESEPRRRQLARECYDQIPEMCQVPNEDWLYNAISELWTRAGSNIKKREKKKKDKKRTKEESSDESPNPAGRKHRRMMDTDDDKGRPNRPKRSYKTSDTESDSERRGRAPKRSREITVPLFETIGSKPNHGTSIMEFWAVRDGELQDQVGEVVGSEIADPNTGVILWARLAEEATHFSDPAAGFHFTNAFYLGPREKQNLSIRTQASLGTALGDMEPGSRLRFTTRSVTSQTSEVANIHKPSTLKLKVSRVDDNIAGLGADSHNTGIQPTTTPQQVAPNLNIGHEESNTTDTTSEVTGSQVGTNTRQVTPNLETGRDDDWSALGPDLPDNDWGAPNYWSDRGPDLLNHDGSEPSIGRLGDEPNLSEFDLLSEFNLVSEFDLSTKDSLQATPNPEFNKDNNAAGPDVGSKIASPQLGAIGPVLPSHHSGFTPINVLGSVSAQSSPSKRAGRPRVAASRPSGSAGEPIYLDSASNNPPSDSGHFDLNPRHNDDDYSDESDEEDDEEDDISPEKIQQQALKDAMEWASKNNASCLTAHMKAEKNSIEVWKNAADTFGVDVSKLQITNALEQDTRITLPRRVGFSSHFKLMPHQLPGAKVLLDNANGPRGSIILGDGMGMGKTREVLTAFHTNFMAVARKADVPAGHMDPWPTLDQDGNLDGISPKPGPTYISASATNIKIWAYEFNEMYGHDSLVMRMPAHWRPKLVFLHADGAKIVNEIQNPMISDGMTFTEWQEVLPAPDWSRARPRYSKKEKSQQVADIMGGDKEGCHWVNEVDDWPTHPGATVHGPSITSTRFIIVSTFQSWNTKVEPAFVEDEYRTNKTWRTLQKNLADAQNFAGKRRTAYFAISAWLATLLPNDGRYPRQATRKMKGPKGTVEMVVDRAAAAFVFIDELHMCASAGTRTYSQIVRPLLEGCPGARRPGIVGITGTPMTNGISLMLTFAEKAIDRVVDRNAGDEGVTALQEVMDTKKCTSAWQTLLTAFQDYWANHRSGTGKNEAIARRDAALEKPEIKDMLNVFATLIEFFCLLRNYQSLDPWGNQLAIVRGELHVENLPIAPSPAAFANVKEAEAAVAATVKRKHREAIAAWKEQGSPPDRRPRKLAMKKADANAYYIARLVSSFPNILTAVEEWDSRRAPGESRVFADGDRCLSTSNPLIAEALRSEATIRSSFLWECAEAICEDSAKMQHIIKQVARLSNEKTTVPHPDRLRRAQGEKLTYKSKYIIASTLRVGCAIVWARLEQLYGDGRIVMVAEGKARNDLIPKWQRYYDPANDRVDDKVNVLVVGLGCIAEAVTLIEGSVFEGLEPPPKNSQAVQAAMRQYRPGQEADHIYVHWLVTTDPEKRYQTHDESTVHRNNAKSSITNKFKETKAGAVESAQKETMAQAHREAMEAI